MLLSIKLLLAILAALGLSRILYILFLAALDPLRSVPGPLLARFTRLWWFRALAQGEFEKINIALHKKYGTIFRVAPGQYSIDDPEAAKIIYSFSKVFAKSTWYIAAGHPDHNKPNSFAEQSNVQAVEDRRKMASGFALNAMLVYEGNVEDCATLLCQRLRERVSAIETLDLRQWILSYAFDIQGAITFSKRFGFLDAGEDIGGIHASLDQRLVYATLVGVYPNMHPYTFKLVEFIAGATGAVDYSLEFTIKKIAERQAMEKTDLEEGPPDMLTKFLHSHAEDPARFTDWDVVMGSFGNIVAGADTTWVTICAILYFLLKNPEKLRKLRHEIDEMASRGSISNPVRFKETQGMQYLQAVIKEAMRLFPATGLPLWRVVPEPGATLSGRFFPAGTVVGINNWVAHRNISVYGTDHELFRPERWLEADKEALAKMDQYYMAFGIGPRICMGQNISSLVTAKLIPQLLREFEFELEDRLKGSGPEHEWKTYNFWLIKPVEFRCKVKLRS